MFILGSLESAYCLVLIERFSLGITAEALRANIDLKSAISLQRDRLTQTFRNISGRPTNHFSF